MKFELQSHEKIGLSYSKVGLSHLNIGVSHLYTRLSMPTTSLGFDSLPGAGPEEGPPEAGALRGAAPEGAMAVVPLSLSIGTASADYKKHVDVTTC